MSKRMDAVGASTAAKTGERENHRKGGLSKVLTGVGWIVVGFLLTWGKYMLAEAGGAYWVFYGIVIYGFSSLDPRYFSVALT